MSVTRTAETPSGPRPPAPWSRAVATLARLTRYHGVWGPGVNLLRNLPLRQKSLIVAVGVGLMLTLALAEAGRLRWNEWSTASAALHGATEVRAVERLQVAALSLNRAVFLADVEGNREVLAPALAREAEAVAAHDAAIAGLLAAQPQLQRAQSVLASRRSELLARSGDAVAPAADGRPSERLLASRRYADAIAAVRYELMLHWSATLEADVESRVLRNGLLDVAAQTQTRLHRLVGQAMLLYVPQPAATQRQVLVEKVIELRAVRELSRPYFEHARTLVPEQAAALDDHTRQIDEAINLVDRLAHQPADAAAGDVAGRTLLQTRGASALAAAQGIGELGLDLMERRLQERLSSLQSSGLIEGGLLTLCMLLTAYLLVCSYKVLAGGLNFLCSQVDELGRGNLAIRPNGHGKDEIGRALRVLGQSAAQMSSLFEAVTHGVAAVSHASRMVATGNAGLSDRTAEIRASISSVSDSTQAFSGSMDRCNDAVDRASDHVRAMRAEGQRCRKAMASLKERMRILQRKSREIEQVVGMVEAVAYQTRLLAINASVEAARAGTAGKGFAVVAQEVRALATRSQQATHRIQDIVNTSITEIDAGHQMSERLGQALVRSDQEVESASAVIGEMVGLVRASQAQSVDVLNIARGVDDSIVENARLVDQLSQASAELRDEGDTLKRSVQHFEFG